MEAHLLRPYLKLKEKTANKNYYCCYDYFLTMTFVIVVAVVIPIAAAGTAAALSEVVVPWFS